MNKRLGIIMFVAAIATFWAFSCRNGERAVNNAPDDDVVILEPAGAEPVAVTVELAVTAQQRQLGLMYRKSLDPSQGMLFIFDREAPLTFWMKNTMVELDMLFIRSDMTVLGCVEQAEPLTTTPRSVPGNSKYVLEVVGGFCEAHNINERARVKFNLPSVNINR